MNQEADFDEQELAAAMRELASQIILQTSSYDRGSSYRLEVALADTFHKLVAFREKYPRRPVDLARMADLGSSTDIFRSKDDSPVAIAWTGVLQDALWFVGHKLSGHRTSETRARSAFFQSLKEYRDAVAKRDGK